MSFNTYAEILAAAKKADCVHWYRDRQTLNIYAEDMKADRKTCVEVRMRQGAAGVVEVRTLKDYDAKAQRWGDYCDPIYRLELPNRRGQKAILAWLAELATQAKGFPNPEHLSIYGGIVQ